MRSYRIYLYRHGMTDGNLEGRYIGVTDVDLCPQGVEQLLKLKQEQEYPGVGKLYASPLKRCVQTAGLLYPDMPIHTVEGIREFDFGAYENRTIAELKEDKDFVRWMEAGATQAPKGGEDPAEFSTRIREGFDTIIKDMMKHKISSAAVVTHGGVIMTALGMCGLPRMKPTNWAVEPGHGYSILVNASLWGNTASFEICDPLPYPTDEEYEIKNYDVLDVEELRRRASE